MMDKAALSHIWKRPYAAPHRDMISLVFVSCQLSGATDVR